MTRTEYLRGFRALQRAIRHYNNLGANLPEIFDSETGLYLLDRWSQRVEQLDRQLDRDGRKARVLWGRRTVG